MEFSKCVECGAETSTLIMEKGVCVTCRYKKDEKDKGKLIAIGCVWLALKAVAVAAIVGLVILSLIKYVF